jgi:hypothetical protein
MRKAGDKDWWPAPTRDEWRATLTPAEYEQRRRELRKLALKIEQQMFDRANPTFTGKWHAASAAINCEKRQANAERRRNSIDRPAQGK